jgi:hypothetical protein
MLSVSKSVSVGGERRFALLMIALSVAIFVAIWRAEREKTTQS